MTLVVCPNLAIDRVLAATAVRPGATMRCRALFQQAGSKGANVARALGLLGGGALLTGFEAGHAGRLFADLAAGEGLEVDLVPGVGEVRVSTVVLADDGRVTRLYEYGPRIGPAEERALTHAVAAHHAAAGEWALVTGAAPPGAAAGLYAGLVGTLHAGGYHVMVDATEAQLAGALAAGPDFVKVNLDEACTAVGGPSAHCVDASRAPGGERPRQRRRGGRRGPRRQRRMVGARSVGQCRQPRRLGRLLRRRAVAERRARPADRSGAGAGRGSSRRQRRDGAHRALRRGRGARDGGPGLRRPARLMTQPPAHSPPRGRPGFTDALRRLHSD